MSAGRATALRLPGRHAPARSTTPSRGRLASPTRRQLPPVRVRPLAEAASEDKGQQEQPANHQPEQAQLECFPTLPPSIAYLLWVGFGVVCYGVGVVLVVRELRISYSKWYLPSLVALVTISPGFTYAIALGQVAPAITLLVVFAWKGLRASVLSCRHLAWRGDRPQAVSRTSTRSLSSAPRKEGFVGGACRGDRNLGLGTPAGRPTVLHGLDPVLRFGAVIWACHQHLGQRAGSSTIAWRAEHAA